MFQYALLDIMLGHCQCDILLILLLLLLNRMTKRTGMRLMSNIIGNNLLYPGP